MDIGARIRQLRNKNNLTLEELASRCELTKGFLSQLERNLTSPSISTLEDIVEALGMTRDSRLPSRKTTGTRKYTLLILPMGLVSTLTVTSLAPMALM